MNEAVRKESAYGLSRAEAQARLRLEGFNELPSSRPRNLRTIALGAVREPMFMLLIAAGGIYLFLGDVHEALVLLASVLVIIAITIYQERKTERALEALRDLASPRALVIRDGERERIPGREVVRGDVMILEEGDRVSADAVLWHVSDLRVDESLLTGESVPVNKANWDGIRQWAHPGGEDLPFIYSGTLVVQGHGLAEVIATGPTSEIGRIGKALATIEQDATPLQVETRRVVRDLALLGLALCVLVVILYGMLRGPWLEGVLAGITLSMATIPEEFPVVLTVFLALGAWRMSKHRVLTRRASAIETLGAATVLCVDKTGTLTMNRMTLRELYAVGTEYRLNGDEKESLPEALKELLRISILASEVTPFDPMEKAFHDAGAIYLPDPVTPLGAGLVKEYALSPELLVHTHGWSVPGQAALVAAKGAPEAIADVCRLSPAQRKEVDLQTSKLAAKGLRVLGVAKASFQGGDWPRDQREFQFAFLGLVGLADPVRPTVAEAIRQCYQAGMRVVMVTGDYPVTAQAIAQEIGLRDTAQVLSGTELARMTDTSLARASRRVDIFARVVPEQKLRLVNALKHNGEVVAMTGDGVNDAPALKAAHIGVAMGRRGTDVAREAAALVLLEDDFASLVAAVRMGRRIYDNIQNAMYYLLAVHVPTAGMALLPILFGWPMVFYPVHIVFLEFVIDPACSVAFEAEQDDSNSMKRPPRAPSERLFSLRTLVLSLLQGTGVLLVVASAYGYAVQSGVPDSKARTLAFTMVVLANIGLILLNRSRTDSLRTTLRRSNPVLWWIIGLALAALAAAVYIRPVSQLFRFEPLSVLELAMCVGAAAMSLAWYEVYKLVKRVESVDDSPAPESSWRHRNPKSE